MCRLCVRYNTFPLHLVGRRVVVEFCNSYLGESASRDFAPPVYFHGLKCCGRPFAHFFPRTTRPLLLPRYSCCSPSWAGNPSHAEIRPAPRNRFTGFERGKWIKGATMLCRLKNIPTGLVCSRGLPSVTAASIMRSCVPDGVDAHKTGATPKNSGAFPRVCACVFVATHYMRTSEYTTHTHRSVRERFVLPPWAGASTR